MSRKNIRHNGIYNRFKIVPIVTSEFLMFDLFIRINHAKVTTHLFSAETYFFREHVTMLFIKSVTNLISSQITFGTTEF